MTGFKRSGRRDTGAPDAIPAHGATRAPGASRTPDGASEPGATRSANAARSTNASRTADAARSANVNRAPGTASAPRRGAATPAPRDAHARGGIFFRFTLRSLRQNKVRTGVSIAGIALACALLTAVLTSVVSLQTMLASRTAADEGAWLAAFYPVDDQALAKLERNRDLERFQLVTNLGVTPGERPSATDMAQTYYLLQTWPARSGEHQVSDAAKNRFPDPLIKTPDIVQGKAPAKAGEAVFPEGLKGRALAGSGITIASSPKHDESGAPVLAVGAQVKVALGRADVNDPERGVYTMGVETGTYVDTQREQVAFTETGTRELIVTGFTQEGIYSANPALASNSIYLFDDGSAAAQALANPQGGASVSASIALTDPSSLEQVSAEVSGHDTGITWTGHGSLLRWLGVFTSGSSVFQTLYVFAGTLAVVVVGAGISLIYNSFAISVSERMRQFGLLASLGASKRQIRRTVLSEALLLALIGIPLGVALGLAGCLAVFHLTAEGIGLLVRSDLGGGPVAVTLSLPALALAVALSLVTVLMSAWVPARRAANVSAIDALRQTRTVRLSRRARRSLARAAHADARAPKRRPRPSLRALLFGVPGLIAQRNLTRSSSKGRVTVAALAVSCALLIFTGSLSSMTRFATTSWAGSDTDGDLRAVIGPTSEADQQALAGDDPASAVASWKARLDEVRTVAHEAAGGTLLGLLTDFTADATMPSSMVRGVDEQEGGYYINSNERGTASAYVSLLYLDRASWDAYVAKLGLDPAAFSDPRHPRAIALNAYRTRNGTGYHTVHPLIATGTLDLYRFRDLSAQDLYPYDIRTHNGSLAVVCSQRDRTDNVYLPLDEAVAARSQLDIAALADEAPAGMGSPYTLTLILPWDALGAPSLVSVGTFDSSSLAFSYDGDATKATKGEAALKAAFPDGSGISLWCSNYALQQAQTRLTARTVEVFLGCFTIICGAIAIANVFNTLSSALILRRREFAVLRSVGMDERQFRTMIVCECLSYGLRGLVIGVLLALTATFVLYQGLSLGFSGYLFAIPWAHIAASALIVAAVIAVSVVYALRKTKAASLIDTLREDAI